MLECSNLSKATTSASKYTKLRRRNSNKQRSDKSCEVCDICHMDKRSKRSRLLYGKYTCPCDIDIKIDNIMEQPEETKDQRDCSEASASTDNVCNTPGYDCGLKSLLLKLEVDACSSDVQVDPPDKTKCTEQQRRRREGENKLDSDLGKEYAMTAKFKGCKGNLNNSAFVHLPETFLYDQASGPAYCIKHRSFDSLSNPTISEQCLNFSSRTTVDPAGGSPPAAVDNVLPLQQGFNGETSYAESIMENDKTYPAFRTICRECKHQNPKCIPLRFSVSEAKSKLRNNHLHLCGKKCSQCGKCNLLYLPQRCQVGVRAKRHHRRPSRQMNLKTSYLLTKTSGGFMWRPALLWPLREHHARLLCRPATGINDHGYELYLARPVSHHILSSNKSSKDHVETKTLNCFQGFTQYGSSQTEDDQYQQSLYFSPTQHAESVEDYSTDVVIPDPMPVLTYGDNGDNGDDNFGSGSLDYFVETLYAQPPVNPRCVTSKPKGSFCYSVKSQERSVECVEPSASEEKSSSMPAPTPPLFLENDQTRKQFYWSLPEGVGNKFDTHKRPCSKQYECVNGKINCVKFEQSKNIGRVSQNQEERDLVTVIETSGRNSPPNHFDFSFRFDPPLTVNLVEKNNSNEAGSLLRDSAGVRCPVTTDDQYSGIVVRVEGDGRCLFRSLVTDMSSTLQTARRDEYGRPVRREEEEKETASADDLRARVVRLMRDNLHFYSQLEGGVLNADQPRPLSYQRFLDRLEAMARPGTMPGDLELNAVAMVLERPILVLNTDLRRITVYGQERFPQMPVLAVRYTRLVADVGHYDAVLLDLTSSPQSFLRRSVSDMEVDENVCVQAACNDFVKLSLGNPRDKCGDGDVAGARGPTKMQGKAQYGLNKAVKEPKLLAKMEYNFNRDPGEMGILQCGGDFNHSHATGTKKRTSKDGSKNRWPPNSVDKGSKTKLHREKTYVENKQRVVSKMCEKKKCQMPSFHEKCSETAESELKAEKRPSETATQTLQPGRYPSSLMAGSQSAKISSCRSKEICDRHISAGKSEARVTVPTGGNRSNKDANVATKEEKINSEGKENHGPRIRGHSKRRSSNQDQGVRRKTKTAREHSTSHVRKKKDADKNDNSRCTLKRRHRAEKSASEDEELSCERRPTKAKQPRVSNYENPSTDSAKNKSGNKCPTSKSCKPTTEYNEKKQNRPPGSKKSKTFNHSKRKEGGLKPRSLASPETREEFRFVWRQKSDPSIHPPRVPDIHAAGQINCFLCGKAVAPVGRSMLQCYLCGRVAHKTCAVSESSCWANSGADSGDLYFLCAECVPL
ncbi:uncharacterized protein LOC101853460 [Aplysia californica]|uniref:Uncharacterized protein LOC101853460 n=1 Tax=Aplysia californica TaxID=6500 RepID=A0ABM0JP80_APLCA|nr:uncharacterized protein LOC101853460 [Aplysia californica]